MAGKNLLRRNHVLIYIRPEYVPVYNEFQKLVELDEGIRKLQTKKKDKLSSIAICQLILKYVKEKRVELNIDSKEKLEELRKKVIEKRLEEEDITLEEEMDTTKSEEIDTEEENSSES